MLTLTGCFIGDIFRHVVIVERFALFAILSSRVVLAVVADATGHSSRSLINRFIEVTGFAMIVAIALPARVRLLADRRFPRQIVIEVVACLAVQTLGVVSALASAMDHVLLVDDAGQRQTFRGVSVARTGTADHHVLDGVIVFLADFGPIIE